MKAKIVLSVLVTSLFATAAFADTVKINNFTNKTIKLWDGDNLVTPWTNTDGRIYYSLAPKSKEFKLEVGDDAYNILTSRGTSAPSGCNYNFDFTSDDNYQNGGCTKLFDSAPNQIVMTNNSINSVYPAFDNGWGYAADSIFGYLGTDQSTIYTPDNKFLKSLGIKNESSIKKIGFYDQNTVKYITCEENVTFTGPLRYSISYDNNTQEAICSRY